MAEPGLPARGGPVLEPEVLDSLEEASRPGFGAGPRARGVIFASPRGCGCLAVPFAVVAGVVLSSLLALLWVARALRVVGSVGSRIAEALGAGRRRPGG